MADAMTEERLVKLRDKTAAYLALTHEQALELFAEVVRLRKIAKAAQVLALRLKLVGDDPEHVSVYTVAAVHGFPYTGPTYCDELEALERLLSNAT